MHIKGLEYIKDEYIKYICVSMYICTLTGLYCMYESGLKSSFDDIISAVDDFFDQWDPSTVTLMEEIYVLHGAICWKINHIRSYSIRVSWSAY